MFAKLTEKVGIMIHLFQQPKIRNKEEYANI